MANSTIVKLSGWILLHHVSVLGVIILVIHLGVNDIWWQGKR
jgi:hypothetical protein